MSDLYGGRTREEVAAAVMDDAGTIRYTVWGVNARGAAAAGEAEVRALARFLRRRPVGKPRWHAERKPLPQDWRLRNDTTPQTCVVVELDTEPRGLLPRIRNRRTTDTGGPRT